MRQIYVFALTFFGVKNVTSSPLYHETLGKGSPVTMQEISTTRPLLVLSVDFSTLTTSGGARTTSWNWADSGDPENMIESYCSESVNDYFAYLCQNHSCLRVCCTAVVEPCVCSCDVSQADVGQVWSPTQFYSVDFSQSRIGVKECVFNKRTIKVCVSCC